MRSVARLIPLVGLGLASAACSTPEDPADLVDTDLSLYALVQSIDGMVFYPPLGPEPTPSGVFDGSLLGAMSVVLETTDAGGTVRTVATFDQATTPPLQLLAAHELYFVNVPAATYITDPALAYRFRVLLRDSSGAREIGRSDLTDHVFTVLSYVPSLRVGVKVRLEGRAAPTLTAISPAIVTQASNPVTLTLTGTHFVQDSEVYCAALGHNLAATWVSDHELRATLPGDVANVPGVYGIQVVTRSPGGGTTAARSVTVAPPTPPATVSNLNAYGYSIWDIDFDNVGNTYLTEYISGPDHLHRIDPAGNRYTYTAASNYDLGFSATTPDGSVIVGAHAWCGTGGVVVRQGSSLVTIIPTPSPCSCTAVSFGGYSVCGAVDPEWGYDGWFYVGNIPAMNNVGRFHTDGTREAIVTLPTAVISVATLPSGELFAAAGAYVYTIDKAAHRYTTLAALGSQITSIATAANTGFVYAETQAREIWEINPLTGSAVRKLTGLTDPGIITVGPDFRLYRVRAKVDRASTIESYAL